MIEPSSNMEALMAIINSETADFYPQAKAKTGKATKVIEPELPPHEVVVAKAEAQVFACTEQEFSIEYQVPEEVIKPNARLTFFGLLLTKEKQRGFGIRVIVADIPAVEVPVDNRKPEGQVPEPLGNSKLYLKGERLQVVFCVVGQLPAHVTENKRSGNVAGSVDISSGRICSEPKRGIACHLGCDHF